jgi:hypothetical protein
VLDYEQEESLNFEEIDDSARNRGTEQKLYSVSNRSLHNLGVGGSVAEGIQSVRVKGHNQNLIKLDFNQDRRMRQETDFVSTPDN